MQMQFHAPQPKEPTLDDEFAAFGNDDVVEMTNLQESDTGIPGIIFISTAMGSYGPRVKYFIKAGRQQPSFSGSIAKNPQFWPPACRSRT